MILKIYTFIMFFSTALCYSQNKEIVTIETTGASISGQVDVQNEFYGQYRGVFVKTGLSARISLLAGLNHSKINNSDFLEFPLLFQYQATPKLKVFVGPQLVLTRDGNTGEFKQRGVSFTIGVNYELTKNWDASIQFLQPLIQKERFKTPSSLLPNPIRLRTGFKF